nr:MAG TPA: hypothetical protein [Bacteriophage sp.]
MYASGKQYPEGIFCSRRIRVVQIHTTSSGRVAPE